MMKAEKKMLKWRKREKEKKKMKWKEDGKEVRTKERTGRVRGRKEVMLKKGGKASTGVQEEGNQRRKKGRKGRMEI